MLWENKHKFTTQPSYTAIPAYVIGNSNYTFLHPLNDSSGKVTSVIDNWPYYPAISTY